MLTQLLYALCKSFRKIFLPYVISKYDQYDIDLVFYKHLSDPV